MMPVNPVDERVAGAASASDDHVPTSAGTTSAPEPGPAPRETRPPMIAELPPRRERAHRRGPPRTTIELDLVVVTPIFGGGFIAGQLDDIDVIRAQTVRGHLRFWWRALHAHTVPSSELYLQESALWGHAADESGGRSSIEVRVMDVARGSIDESDPSARPVPGYALWPARVGRDAFLPRRAPGTRCKLVFVAPCDGEAVLRDAIRIWLLFGGYGSRTRRGLGSLRVTGSAMDWLPAKPERGAFTTLFRRDIFATSRAPASDTPSLAGASLHVGPPNRDALAAWTTALGWLREFRQGASGPDRGRAREPDPDTRGPGPRPSISNWPEADKVRRLSIAELRRGETWSHDPRHNATPAWPRAGFGLPIVGRFQTRQRERQGQRFSGGGVLREPSDYELQWRRNDPAGGGRRADGDDESPDRLASPVIVKAMALADGRHVPCALWLHRAYPEDAQVVLVRGSRNTSHQSHSRATDERMRAAHQPPARDQAVGGPQKAVVPGSHAPFDRLVADGDPSWFSALAGKSTLREAFLTWLRDTQKTTEVAP